MPRRFLRCATLTSSSGASSTSSYERVNVEFARQVVGKKKETRISRYDSLMAVKKIQQLIIAAQKMDTMALRQVKPLETGNVSEHQLKNYDLVPDSAAPPRANRSDTSKTRLR